MGKILSGGCRKTSIWAEQLSKFISKGNSPDKISDIEYQLECSENEMLLEEAIKHKYDCMVLSLYHEWKIYLKKLLTQCEFAIIEDEFSYKILPLNKILKKISDDMKPTIEIATHKKTTSLLKLKRLQREHIWK